MIRLGSYGVYNGKEYEITGYKGNNKVKLLSYDESDLQNGFGQNPNFPRPGVFIKIVDLKDIEKAFDVTTYCKYRGKVVDLLDENDDSYLIGTGNHEIYKSFKFNMRTLGDYDKWVKKHEIKEIWEDIEPREDYMGEPIGK